MLKEIGEENVIFKLSFFHFYSITINFRISKKYQNKKMLFIVPQLKYLLKQIAFN